MYLELNKRKVQIEVGVHSFILSLHKETRSFSFDLAFFVSVHSQHDHLIVHIKDALVVFTFRSIKGRAYFLPTSCPS